MRNFLVICSCILLLACSAAEQDGGQVGSETIEVSGTVLTSNMVLHPFSDPAKQDTFRIKLVGDSIHMAMATFEIVGHDGRVLYSESFSANYLLNYDTPLNPTPTQRDEFILNRIDTFFDEANFKVPAITADMTFDSNYGNEAIWEEIEADETAIGFYYLIGKEDGRWIAYSKPQQKVVLYFNCC
ncbi:hypothetical protein [Pontibacter burrus]|uniref:DUF4369 domain-containing protein n=1 Tax=Pontibacter burrus TaxID=2704466 RepID=A0A6B3LS67_9BACT|nr:hypothetical protein [Pontibacter burrus]NEM96818.1 hypothetical protein [Pontibacter burrus]